MGEIVASRCKQILDDLSVEDKDVCGMNEDQVKGFVSVLRRIEALLTSDHSSGKRLNYISYMMEDVLETWAVEVEVANMSSKNERKRGLTKLLKRFLRLRRQGVGMRFKNITAMLNSQIKIEEAEFMAELFHEMFPDDGIDEESSVRSVAEEQAVADRRSVPWPRQTYGQGMVEHFVGMEEDLDKLVAMVVDEDQQNKKVHGVVSVCGVEGLGKTTLARKVYIHHRVRDHFKAFAWVSLDQDYEIGNLLQNLLKQLGAAGAVKKTSAEEKKKGAAAAEEKERNAAAVAASEEKKKSAAAKEQKKSAAAAEEKKNSAVAKEQKKNAAAAVEKENNAPVADDEKKKRSAAAAEEKENNAAAEEQKKGIEEKKKSDAAAEEEEEEEKKSADEDQKKRTEEKRKNAAAEEQKKSSEENMIDQLKETQRKKRCFIVIDGVSDMSQWTQISSAFLQMEGTRILLTTRDETIAAAVGFPYTPSELDEEKGWELLKKYVFRGSKAPDLGIVPKLGKEIVQKCRYLPSAISRLGRALSKIPLSEWHMVIDDVNRYLQSDYQIQSNERSSSDEVFVPRDDRIPYHLKQCFFYLGIFKEDEDVDSEDLTLLWMAEGMVSPKEQEGKEGTVMDTAENYLRELADRNMLQVQVDELSANRGFMRLCLHNHVRELSLYQGEKEDFRLKVVDFSDGKQPEFDPFALFDGTRRLVIHFNKVLYSSSWREMLIATDDLRSLFFLNSDQEYVDLPVMISDFKDFKLLRVVHFVRCKFEGRKLPEGIDQLVNLRYLGIIYCDLDRLPPSISNLRNLYVLNVRANDDAEIIIPNVLSQMVRLKHLRLPNSLDHGQSYKLKLDGLRDLETLVGFNAERHDLASISELEKLRLLVTHAHSNESLESIINFFRDKGADMQTNLSIEYKCNFTSAEGLAILEEVLMCPNLHALTFSMVVIHKFPNCGMHASKDLTQIKLIGCKLGEDPMEALGKFPNLRKLCLGYGAFLGREMAIRYTGFRKLEYLELRCLPNLEEWKVDVGAMQNLSALTVRRCPKLKGIPKGLASNKSCLENMEVELAPSALADGQEAEYHKMFNFVTSCIIRKLDPISACSKE